jgi:hypothetical protein
MKKLSLYAFLGLLWCNIANTNNYDADLSRALEVHKKTKSKNFILNDVGTDLRGIILEEDSNSFKSITFVEEKKKKVRLTPFEKNKKWGSYKVYLYQAEYEDGQKIPMWIDSRFSLNESNNKASEWAKMMGYLPNFLRKSIKKIYIDQRDGNNFVMDDTRLMTMYDGHRAGKDFLKNNLLHESDHLTKYPKKSGWAKTLKADGKTFISHYAKVNAKEDRAETVLAWLVVKYRPERLSPELYDKIIKNLPHRLRFYDKQNFDVYPWNQ